MKHDSGITATINLSLMPLFPFLPPVFSADSQLNEKCPSQEAILRPPAANSHHLSWNKTWSRSCVFSQMIPPIWLKY